MPLKSQSWCDQEHAAVLSISCCGNCFLLHGLRILGFVLTKLRTYRALAKRIHLMDASVYLIAEDMVAKGCKTCPQLSAGLQLPGTCCICRWPKIGRGDMHVHVHIHIERGLLYVYIDA